MQNRSPKPQHETPPAKQPAKLNVINFAPPRLVSAGTAERKLEELRLLLDQGRAHEAQQFIARLLKPTKTNRVSTSVSAKARCALSLSLGNARTLSGIARSRFAV